MSRTFTPAATQSVISLRPNGDGVRIYASLDLTNDEKIRLLMLALDYLRSKAA